MGDNLDAAISVCKCQICIWLGCDVVSMLTLGQNTKWEQLENLKDNTCLKQNLRLIRLPQTGFSTTGYKRATTVLGSDSGPTFARQALYQPSHLFSSLIIFSEVYVFIYLGLAHANVWKSEDNRRSQFSPTTACILGTESRSSSQSIHPLSHLTS